MTTVNSASKDTAAEKVQQKVQQVLLGWQALSLAVEHRYGTQFLTEKVAILAEDLVFNHEERVAQRKPCLSAYEIEDFLILVLDEDYNTVVEDGSTESVAEAVEKIFRSDREHAAAVASRVGFGGTNSTTAVAVEPHTQSDPVVTSTLQTGFSFADAARVTQAQTNQPPAINPSVTTLREPTEQEEDEEDDDDFATTDNFAITPTLNRLRRGGVEFTNYYTLSMCSPSRAALMTGRYPFRYGLQSYVLIDTQPWGLPLTETILPQKLKRQFGYETHLIGKIRMVNILVARRMVAERSWGWLALCKRKRKRKRETKTKTKTETKIMLWHYLMRRVRLAQPYRKQQQQQQQQKIRD